MAQERVRMPFVRCGVDRRVMTPTTSVGQCPNSIGYLKIEDPTLKRSQLTRPSFTRFYRIPLLSRGANFHSFAASGSLLCLGCADDLQLG